MAIHLALPNVRHIVAVVTPFQARSVSFLENLLNTNYEFTKRAFVIIDCGPITEGEESRLRLFYFQVPKTASLKDAETLFFYFTRFLAKYNPGALLEARALKFLPHVFEKYLEDVCRFEREDQLWVEGRLPGLGSTSGEGSENDDPGFSDEGDDGDPYSNFAPFASRTLFGGAVGLEGVSSGSGNTWFLGANENDTKPDARAPDFDDETNPRARRPEQRDPKTLTPKVEESEGRTPPSGRPTPLTTTGSGEGEVTLRVMTDCRLQLHHKGHVYVLTQKYDNESGVVYRFDPLGEGDNYRLIKASSPIGQMVARLEKEGQIIF
ncbi:MAG TPA: hypothetical protein DDW49_06900 [Deltaproteobacteria bacterium]|nr:hypothetical protein [Deltaproteobacteria bacterium]